MKSSKMNFIPTNSLAMLNVCGILIFYAFSSLEAKTFKETDYSVKDESWITWKSKAEILPSKNCGSKLMQVDSNLEFVNYDQEQYTKDCETKFESKEIGSIDESDLLKDNLLPVRNQKVQDLNGKPESVKKKLINNDSERVKRALKDPSSIPLDTVEQVKLESTDNVIEDAVFSSTIIGPLESDKVTDVPDEANRNSKLLGHFSGQSILNTQSFIFNPNAQPQEKFQSCRTPRNETGLCRYLQHCMVPNIISSLNQFMGYVCIINRRYIGVCCPILPANTLEVPSKEVTKELNKDNNEELNEVAGNTTTECGIGTNTRIVGGLKADPKAWPWMVALLAKSRKRFFCGGALITNRYVLTAAHCTFGIRNNEIIARLGEYDFKDDNKTHTDYAVTKIKRHGFYNRRALKNDIALLELEKPVVFNEFIQTVCLPEVEKSYDGDIASLTGWGNVKGSLLGDGTTSNVLQEASFPVISNKECAKVHGIIIAESFICSKAMPGDKGACNGDSGGPLMLLDKNNRWKIIGIVSWGRRGCNPEFPTVYTRVSHFLEWINKHSRT